MSRTSTERLISQYDDAVKRRHVNAPTGGARATQRQRTIEQIVDELSRRADNGDEVALRWYNTDN